MEGIVDNKWRFFGVSRISMFEAYSKLWKNDQSKEFISIGDSQDLIELHQEDIPNFTSPRYKDWEWNFLTHKAEHGVAYGFRPKGRQLMEIRNDLKDEGRLHNNEALYYFIGIL